MEVFLEETYVKGPEIASNIFGWDSTDSTISSNLRILNWGHFAFNKVALMHPCCLRCSSQGLQGGFDRPSLKRLLTREILAVCWVIARKGGREGERGDGGVGGSSCSPVTSAATACCPDVRGPHDLRACCKVIMRWMPRARHCNPRTCEWRGRWNNIPPPPPQQAVQRATGEIETGVTSEFHRKLLFFLISRHSGKSLKCTSIMYWSTMCSSATGPVWDLYISTSSEVGTNLETEEWKSSGWHCVVQAKPREGFSACWARLQRKTLINS